MAGEPSATGFLDPVTGKGLGRVSLWRLGSTDRAGAVAWLPDGSVVVAEAVSTVHRYSAAGKPLVKYEVAPLNLSRPGPSVAGVVASPDGKTVLLTGEG